MDALGFSIVGGGFMAKLHTLAVSSYKKYFYPPAVEINREFIADSDVNAAVNGMNRFGFKKYTTDWKDVVTDPDTDIVDICTPNDTHKEIVLEAAKKGKHVFCEKPLSVNARDAYEMYEAVVKAGVINAVGHNNRAIPAVRMLKKLIDAGEIGDIYSFQMRYIQSWGLGSDTPMQWRFSARCSGNGALGDIGSHAIDISRYLLGDIRKVVSQSRTFIKERKIIQGALLSQKADDCVDCPTAKVDVDDDVKVLVEFENGTTGTLWASRFCAGHEDTLDIEIYGSKGSARFSRERPNELEFYRGSDPEDISGFKKIKMGPQHPYGELWPMPDLGVGYVEQKCIDLKHFFEAIAKNDNSLVNVDFYGGYKVCSVIDAIKESAVSGKWVSVQN